MKIQKIILLSVMSMLSVLLLAQTAPQKRGDKLYNKYSYEQAIRAYERVKEKPIEVKRNLAASHYHLSQYAQSEEWSKAVVETSGYTALDAYNYAYILRMNKQYAQSEEWMNRFYAMNSQDSRAQEAQVKAGSYKSLEEDSRRYEIKNLKMNTPSQEFGPNFYQSEIVFASSRGGNQTRVWNGNNQPFLNFYKGKQEEDLELENIKPFYAKKNKKWHEGPVAFDETGTKMAFTRNNYEGASANDIKKLMLFTSEYKDGKWSKAEGMPFNSAEYSVGHASLSPDGNTMYFASDMPGGYGGIDIYKTVKQGGTWSAPINLGPTVNTEGREMFPFIDYDGKTLFYASDGHYGLGGLDLFMSSVRGEQYGKPRNLGFPINSSYDDFALIIDKDYEAGYFSSNRPEGHGDDDIYSFKLLKPFCKPLKGVARDKGSQALLSNTKVGLYNQQGDLVEEVETGADGSYEFCIEDASVYALRGTKIDYEQGEVSANMQTNAEEVIADLYLAQEIKMSLYDKVVDANTGAALSGVKSTLIPCDGSAEEVYYTSASGDFSKAITKNLGEQECFSIRYEKAGYESKEVAYNFSLDRKGQYNIAEQLTATKGKTVSPVEEAPYVIAFNCDYNLSERTKSELDRIVSWLTANPNQGVAFSVNANCKGSRKSNQLLSENRLGEILRYVQSRVSNPSRVTGTANGASNGSDETTVRTTL